ncbi:MAG: GIY-YIG nuclease family protein [Planctomycetes bacterium]|nr:GIY-YIG nuclease family protein [Planctomycetota bacterium]
MGFMAGFILASLGVGAIAFLITEHKRRRLNMLAGGLESDRRRMESELKDLVEKQRAIGEEDRQVKARRKQVDEDSRRLEASRSEFEARAATYHDLQAENEILKQDLVNLDVASRKLELDRNLQATRQAELDQRASELGSRYLKESLKWISSSLNQNNLASCKQRLLDVVERCRGIGLPVRPDEESGLVANLRHEYEEVVRIAVAREEQAEIRARMREELQREREKQKLEKELQDARRGQEATARAVAEVEGKHLAEVERVRAEMAHLAAAERERALAQVDARYAAEMQVLDAENARLTERVDALTPAVSQARLTKAGNVYVISNIGSFGPEVFKVGMTRRLDPQERIDELGDASVPFPFDVHFMIASNDAPALENALHKGLHKSRLNKVNLRKEFFKVSLDTIAQIVKENHGEVKYKAEPEALEYRESVSMSADDQEYIEEVYDRVDDGDVEGADNR